MAGALGVQLGGLNYYDGVAHDGELIGDDTTALTIAHVDQATRIMVVAAGLGLFFALLSLWVS